MINYSLEDLQNLGKEKNFEFSDEQHEIVERLTCISSDEWWYLRLGRITGTKFKLCARGNIDSPSATTLRKISYTQKDQAFVPAMEFGKKHEKIALTEIETKLKKEHAGFCVEECCLILSINYMYIFWKFTGCIM